MTILMGRNSIEAFKLASEDAGEAYSLTVLNEHSKWQQFAFYQTMPKVIGPSIDPTSLAWMVGSAAAGSPTNPSQSSFNWTIDYSLTVGYIQQQFDDASKLEFKTASSVGVMINSQNTVPVSYQGNFPSGVPGFSESPSDGTKGLIVAKSDSTIPNSKVQVSKSKLLNVGLAMAGKPTVSVQLEPNLIYQFTPKPRYYILAGQFTEGQVVDTSTSTSAFEIVFQGVTDMAVRFTENNQFVAA